MKQAPWKVQAGAVLVLLALLRAQDLFTPCLNWDEANVLATAKLPLDTMWRVLAHKDFHPPGTHVLLQGWIQLFGDSDPSVRLFPWFFGILGLIATYGLALKLSGSRLLSLLVSVLGIASPFLFRHSQLVTPYSIHATLVLTSWFCLLQTLKPYSSDIQPAHLKTTAWRIAYFFVTLLAVQQHALGVLFLGGQTLFLLWQKRHAANMRETPAIAWPLALLLLAGLSMTPFYWNAMQPWHASHMPEMEGFHTDLEWPFILAAPANFLLLGIERYQQMQWDAQTWLTLVLSYGLLVGGMLALKKQSPQTWLILFCLALAPFGLSILIALITGRPVFQFRTQLYDLFSLHYVIATGLCALGAGAFRQTTSVSSAASPNAWIFRLLTGVLLTIVMIGQAYSPARTQFKEDAWRRLAKTTRQFEQPGDGIVLFPGWHHVAFIRYYRPQEFGVTSREINLDPTRDNLFHMVNRMDDDIFAFSGDETLERPDVRMAFFQFIQQHLRQSGRILLIGDTPHYRSLFSCRPHVWLLTIDQDRFTPYPCGQ